MAIESTPGGALLKRLFALVVLLTLAGAALYYYWGLPSGDQARLGAVGHRLQEAKVTASVRAALALNRNLKPYAIEVATENGVVTLRGQVPTPDLSELAGRVAGAVPDVVQVVNHLQVAAGPAAASGPEARSIGESLDDRSLEVEVRFALSLRRELGGTDITVSVFRRQVTLSGELARGAQRDVALEAARAVPGVSGVTDNIKVRGEATPWGSRSAESAIRANPNLAPYGLKVEEERGKLVLRGRVRTGAEKDLAGLLAREGAGGPVENALQIMPR
jgi:osmotically-inducible protein OsmY